MYMFKSFIANCATSIINGHCDKLTDGGGWLVEQ